MAVQPFLTSINGRFDATVSPIDRGLAFGDGVFETIRFHSGKLNFLNLHIERLIAGLTRLQIALARATIETQIHGLLTQAKQHHFSEGIVKITVTRGEGRGYAPLVDTVPTIILSLFPAPTVDHHCRDGVTITVCQQRLSYQPSLVGIKHLNRLDNVLAAVEIQQKNAVEGLMLNDKDEVVEGISRNLFVVKNGNLLTPSLHRGGVEGVMRRVIIETLTPVLELQVEETTMNLTNLLESDEVFLCNSITGIWPVTMIGSHSFPVGPVTQRLQTVLEAQWSVN